MNMKFFSYSQFHQSAEYSTLSDLTLWENWIITQQLPQHPHHLKQLNNFISVSSNFSFTQTALQERFSFFKSNLYFTTAPNTKADSISPTDSANFAFSLFSLGDGERKAPTMQNHNGPKLKSSFMGWTARQGKQAAATEANKKSLEIEAAEHRKTEGKIKFRSRFANAIELAWVCVSFEHMK